MPIWLVAVRFRMLWPVLHRRLKMAITVAKCFDKLRFSVGFSNHLELSSAQVLLFVCLLQKYSRYRLVCKIKECTAACPISIVISAVYKLAKFPIACAAIEYFYRDLLIEFGGVNEIR